MHITRKNLITQTPQATAYRSRDIYLVAVAIEAGIPLLGVESNGHQGIFLLQQEGKLQEVITGYFNGTLRLNPKSLFENLKALKSQAYSAIGSVR